VQLKKAKVTKFRSIDDSGWVDFDDVTCLVGKNESGKTAFLQALARLRPVAGQPAKFDPVMDYPSKDYGPYRRRHEQGDVDVVVRTELELKASELAGIERDFGEGVLTSGNVIRLEKNYANRSTWGLSTDETVVVKHLISKAQLDAAVKAEAAKVTTVEELQALLSALAEPSAAATQVLATISRWTGGFRQVIADRYLDAWAPRFFYFDEYSVMEGRVSIQHLRDKVQRKDLDDSDRTFLAFLKVGGAELEEFEDDDNFERLTRSLEATANGISREVFQYWTQNKQLSVSVVTSKANPDDEPPLDQGTILNVRVRNERHGVTVPFDERSRGFVWFFSFFAYFSELQAKPGSLVLLLDEPGLSLHAKAQGDFLSFIEDRLAEDFQVIYTTHSPFLIDPTRLDRARTVEDKDDEGTVVSADVLRNDRDTVFPLQAALGYELAQTLFLGPDCLLVEGPSDLIYLQVLGEAVRDAGGEPLDPRWVVVPVGGADKLSTFVSLIGANQLNVAVLIDVSSRDRQRVNNLQSNGFLGTNSLVELGQFAGKNDADIEDLFTLAFYLKLVNGAMSKELPAKLTLKLLTDRNPRIVRRIDAYYKGKGIGRFNHYPPAAHLQREQGTLLKQLDDTTVERATEMFKVVNALLS